jgi:L-ectoine synthase
VIVRTAAEVHGTAAEVSTHQWTSTRLLLQNDRMGFTITDTVVEPGMDETLWYKHHLEACYCIEGRATLEDLSTGDVYEIQPGTMYALDQHDRHRLRAGTRVRLVCVFSPPLTGQETHDSDRLTLCPPIRNLTRPAKPPPSAALMYRRAAEQDRDRVRRASGGCKAAPRSEIVALD